MKEFSRDVSRLRLTVNLDKTKNTDLLTNQYKYNPAVKHYNNKKKNHTDG